MNTASQELCKELHELSGWNDTDHLWIYTIGKQIAEKTMLELVDRSVKDIYMTKDLPNILQTEEYIKIREELRAELRKSIKGEK